jgi:hypothetical protein
MLHFSFYGVYQTTNLSDIPHQGREGRPIRAISNPDISSRNPLALKGNVSYWIPFFYTPFYPQIQEEKRIFIRFLQKTV